MYTMCQHLETLLYLGSHAVWCRFVDHASKHYVLSHMRNQTFAPCWKSKLFALGELVVNRRLLVLVYVRSPGSWGDFPSILLSFQFPHHLVSAVPVHHASNTESGHDSAHAREAASKPVYPDFGEALLESCATVAIVKVKAQKVERRRDELDRSWRKELRSRGARYVALHFR